MANLYIKSANFSDLSKLINNFLLQEIKIHIKLNHFITLQIHWLN